MYEMRKVAMVVLSIVLLFACGEGETDSGCDADCDSPPSAECIDDDTLRVWEDAGSCESDGSCAYPEDDVECDEGCSDGECVGGANAGNDSNDGNDGNGGGGLTGLEGFCDYYFECGGTWYSDVDACMDASIDQWGECARPELDDFGDCMMGLTCEEWGDPDSYNPASTDCADEWDDVRDTDCS